MLSFISINALIFTPIAFCSFSIDLILVADRLKFLLDTVLDKVITFAVVEATAEIHASRTMMSTALTEYPEIMGCSIATVTISSKVGVIIDKILEYGKMDGNAVQPTQLLVFIGDEIVESFVV
jgi:hypothetical protein